MLLSQAIQELKKLKEEVEGIEEWIEQDTHKEIEMGLSEEENSICYMNQSWI